MQKPDTEEVLLKNSILSTNNTFKTTFKATMGFYTAQFVATILGLIVLGVGFGAIALLALLAAHFLT